MRANRVQEGLKADENTIKWAEHFRALSDLDEKVRHNQETERITEEWNQGQLALGWENAYLKDLDTTSNRMRAMSDVVSTGVKEDTLEETQRYNDEQFKHWGNLITNERDKNRINRKDADTRAKAQTEQEDQNFASNVLRGFEIGSKFVDALLPF
nr:putative ORF1 [Marmot picobirnavirus]